MNFLPAILLLFIARFTESANILALVGSAFKSHHLWDQVIFDELVQRNHSLTILTVQNEVPKSTANTKYIQIEEALKPVDYSKLSEEYGSYKIIMHFYEIQLKTCLGVRRTNFDKLKTTLTSKTYDLILYDSSNGDCLIKFTELFPEIPVISLSATKINNFEKSKTGVVPHFSSAYGSHMGVFQRFNNLGLYNFESFYRTYIVENIITQLMQISDLEKLRNRIKVELLGINLLTDNVASLPQHVIPVAGLHIQKSLDYPEFNDILNDDKFLGNILISLNVNATKDLQEIVEVAKNFEKYKFLVKLENKLLTKEKVPSNVLLSEWFPQQTILHHSRTAGFIIRGGALSIQEAIYFSVPTIIYPISLDHFRNAKYAEDQGFSQTISSIKELSQAIESLLKSNSFKTKVVNQSKLFKSGESKPLDKAIWWIEHVLANPDLVFKSPADDRFFIIQNSLDIYCFFVSLFVLFLFNFIYNLRKAKSAKKTAKKEAKLSKLKTKKNGKRE
ncbi:hypothetical protein ACFFRR_010461 [Megaselia abdita]